MLSSVIKINELLPLRPVLHFLKHITDSLQSRIKVVQKSVKKFKTVSGHVKPYRQKFIDYIEILRAPPVEVISCSYWPLAC